MDYQTYLRSPEWEAKRQEKLDRCQHKCECEGGCHRQATQIHHLHYDTLGNEDLQDLQALCAKCHMAKSHVKNFYGDSIRNCCQKEAVEIDVNANSLEERFEGIAKELGLSEAEKEAFFRECEERVTNDPAFLRSQICHELGIDPNEKTLPYDVYHEANFHYQMKPQRYIEISQEIQCDPVIAALLDNLGIMFACSDIEVAEKTTKAIERFADVVDASETGLDGYCDIAYKIKPEFEHHFIEEEIDI
jgi:hypothetical protein